jgi:hypothetical protein
VYIRVDYQRLPPFFQLDGRIDKRFVFDRFVMSAYLELVNSTLSREAYDIKRNCDDTLDEKGFRIVLLRRCSRRVVSPEASDRRRESRIIDQFTRRFFRPFCGLACKNFSELGLDLTSKLRLYARQPAMASLFRPKHNTLAKLSLLIVVGGAVGGLGGLLLLRAQPARARDAGSDRAAHPVRSPATTPVTKGIDCRFCHSTVDRSPHASIPSSQLCLNCHSQIWNQSPLLDPLRRSFHRGHAHRLEEGQRRPDFVYFNHSIHVNKGVGCVSCHGRIDQMAAVEKADRLTMRWCLDCHRAPEKNLRPVERSPT